MSSAEQGIRTITTSSTRKRPTRDGSGWIASIVERIESTEFARRFVSAYGDFRYWLFRLRRPGANFGDFYAWEIGKELDRGRSHKTLGARVHREGTGKEVGDDHDRQSFAITGRLKFDQILSLTEIAPTERVVDFGCGSLRIGQHVMRVIEPGNYWGFDVTDRFFSEAQSLIDPELLARAKPNLRVINPETLAEAAAAKPSLVISIAVVKHVPPGEWANYFDQLMSLVQGDARLLITYSNGHSYGRRTSRTWTSSSEDIQREILARRPGARFKIARFDAGTREQSEDGEFSEMLATWGS